MTTLHIAHGDASHEYEIKDLFTEGREQQSRVVAEYNYTTAKGELLYQKLRMEPKTFRQRKSENGGWTWKLGDVRRVLILDRGES